jgi:molecular chaperone GrpE
VNESDQDIVNGQGQDGEGGEGASAAPTAEERIAALTAERDEMKDRMLRIAAEFENWKKRARKEQEDAEAKVRESVLRDMLDVTDNLERAVSAYGAPQATKDAKKNGAGPAGPDGAAVLKGVELVLRLLQSKFERHGVKPIEATGQPFDPRLHEAISRVETTAVPAGHVASEMQRGYRIGERLLRPSMVAVAAAPATAAAQGDGSAGDDSA